MRRNRGPARFRELIARGRGANESRCSTAVRLRVLIGDYGWLRLTVLPRGRTVRWDSIVVTGLGETVAEAAFHPPASRSDSADSHVPAARSWSGPDTGERALRGVRDLWLAGSPGALASSRGRVAFDFARCLTFPGFLSYLVQNSGGRDRDVVAVAADEAARDVIAWALDRCRLPAVVAVRRSRRFTRRPFVFMTVDDAARGEPVPDGTIGLLYQAAVDARRRR